jgi:THO complex subunit 4
VWAIGHVPVLVSKLRRPRNHSAASPRPFHRSNLQPPQKPHQQMDTTAPTVAAAAPASRLDMSLDDCIKLSGGPTTKKRGPPPRTRTSKRREKTPRKPVPVADGKPAADGSAAAQNGAAVGGGGGASTAAPDAGRAAGGISKKRRRSKKLAGPNASNAEDGSPAPVARQHVPAPKQKNKAQDVGKGNAAQRTGLTATAKAAPPARSSPPVSTPQAAATSRIAVSNLNDTVSEDDIKELFGDVGPLVSAKLQLDNDGRSSGRAEVVFARMADALEAIKRYNGIPLDEMALRITLATDRSTVVEPSPSVQTARRGGRYPNSQRGESRRGGRGPSRGINKPHGGRPVQRSPTER